MARYEVTGPDGRKFEVNAPDGASQNDAISYIQAQHYSAPNGMNFDRPDQEVRADIAKLPSAERQKALRNWSDRRVEKMYKGTGLSPSPTSATGIPLIGGFLDEAAAAATTIPYWLSGGAVGRPYDENLEMERAYERAAETAKPVQSVVGKVGAGLAGGAALGALAPARTLAGRVGQGVTIGAPLGAVEGYARGEGSIADRMQSAGTGAKFGAAVGAAFPIAATGLTAAAGQAGRYLGPTYTRLRYGPEEAADEILSQRLASSGTSPAQIRLDLQRGQAQAARLGPNSNATLPETIADTSDDAARLLGSSYRAGGEAGQFVRDTLERRQRGPANPYGPRAQGAPDGQRARIMDATERALQIRTAGSALRTERDILAQQRQEGQRLYQQAFNTQQPFDIQPVLDGFALQVQQYPAPFAARMTRALNLFRDNSPNRMPVNRLERFDAAKKALDDMIETAQRQGQGNLTRELTQFKRQLIDAVEAGGRNQDYAAARAAWGSAAEQREAIDLGRAALREGSELSAESYRQLTAGQQQLFRIGFLESVRNALSRKRPGNDVTQLFQEPRVQELMNEIIPRSRGANAVYANRPERFGELMNREQRMVQTRNRVLGNSATAERIQDDIEFTGSTLSTMFQRFVRAPTLFNAAVESVGVGIQRVFGYRQEVALALAQRLLESDRTVQNQILRRLAQRGGANRFTRFADAVDRTSNTLIAASIKPQVLEAE